MSLQDEIFKSAMDAVKAKDKKATITQGAPKIRVVVGESVTKDHISLKEYKKLKDAGVVDKD